MQLKFDPGKNCCETHPVWAYVVHTYFLRNIPIRPKTPIPNTLALQRALKSSNDKACSPNAARVELIFSKINQFRIFFNLFFVAMYF